MGGSTTIDPFAKASIVYTETDASRSITAKVGEVFAIELPHNPKQGSWEQNQIAGL